MVLVTKRFGPVVVAIGIVLLLMGLLAVSAEAEEGDAQYTDEAVCRAVINIIANNSASSQINQYAGSDNVNEIAQELNVSPSIVQECIKENVDEAEEKGVINTPDKDLPDTGGPPLPAIFFSVIAGAGLLTAVVRRRQ